MVKKAQFLAGGLLPLLCGTFAVAEVFNPREYPKQVATCKAVNRAEGKDVDIDLYYVDINPTAEKTLLMVHGWPSLWSSWKYQIEEFKHEYRLLIPDLRGFGSSTHPGDVKSSGNMEDMVSDMICLLEKAEVKSTICVGHDWGSQICYEAGRSRPDIFEAVVGVAIPYIPAGGPFMPTTALLEHLPRLSYQVFFDEHTSDAVNELKKDIRRTLRGTLRTVDSPPPEAFLMQTDSFLAGWSDVKEIDPIPFFSPDEEDYWVEQYGIQKFEYTLEFYTTENRYASWKIAHEQGNYTLHQPVLSVLPTKDPVADWVLAAKLLKSADYLPHITLQTLHGAHWLHIENPDGFNRILRAWLGQLDARAEHSHDEL
ncbi:epoxide hydrolase [Heterobasidion irregulare TC 32-1]|uniref:Epoxide hydrolase n=1 Tax=Heterobasidion irregulare (strain TC 32-1) TaxID=747525 RepID=W4KG08_HETIT|nr:epoxide hydrolase [Heterobasidion irregulare TC 32-1]ETW84768.1 epoxide hydrolase [Heterobasidion irregulare TC 32-1]